MREAFASSCNHINDIFESLANEIPCCKPPVLKPMPIPNIVESSCVVRFPNAEIAGHF
jgi:hypothetical protein